MTESQEMNSADRFMYHYRALKDAVDTNNFYTAIHEAQECIIWEGGLECTVQE